MSLGFDVPGWKHAADFGLGRRPLGLLPPVAGTGRRSWRPSHGNHLELNPLDSSNRSNRGTRFESKVLPANDGIVRE